MSEIYNYQETEFAAAVAAGTFAVYSLEEEAKAKYGREMTENFKKSRTEIRTAKEDSSVPVSKHSSIKELKDEPGKNASLKPPADAMLSCGRLASTSSADRRRPKGTSMGNIVVEDKVDSWEKAQLRKINKRYEKMRAEIIAWENGKKMQATLSRERKKKELEMRKIRNSQHYQIKVDRIEAIAGGAKGQIETKRRNEEAEVKEKAKHMRSRGKNPVSCFCC